MTLVPSRFLFRTSYVCQYVKNVPQENSDDLLALPESCRLPTFSEMDGHVDFADVRLSWNETGLAFQVEVTGKDKEPGADEKRPLVSDGVTFWIDTRDARGSHRASRYCHQFHALPTGGGSENDEPVLLQTKIHRALQDAPLHPTGALPFRCHRLKTGYRLELFLTASSLNGFDPEQHPRLGICYAVRDLELGLQVLGSDADFPYGEDPSLWSALELQAE